MIAIISPTHAQLFLYYIYLAYMFRPVRSSSGHLRYTKGSKYFRHILESLVYLNALMMTE
jgi:hypothetical protein